MPFSSQTSRKTKTANSAQKENAEKHTNETNNPPK